MMAPLAEVQLVQEVLVPAILLASVVILAWVVFVIIHAWRMLSVGLRFPDTGGLVTFPTESASSGGPLADAPDGPATFSGVAYDARYQAPEVLAEALEHERDVRWVRVQRLDGQVSWNPSVVNLTEGQQDLLRRIHDARDVLERSKEAKDLDHLRALDMRAHGAPCVRCGREADEHPEFPACVWTGDVERRGGGL